MLFFCCSDFVTINKLQMLEVEGKDQDKWIESRVGGREESISKSPPSGNEEGAPGEENSRSSNNNNNQQLQKHEQQQ